MAANDLPGTGDTTPDTLSGQEAVDTLVASGGFVVLRYDVNDATIDYRYNPQSGTCEQLVVKTDTDDTLSIDQYFKLSMETARLFLSEPDGFDISKPDVLAHRDSYFTDVNTEPTGFGGDNGY